jgi:hypothetical protein
MTERNLYRFTVVSQRQIAELGAVLHRALAE